MLSSCLDNSVVTYARTILVLTDKDILRSSSLVVSSCRYSASYHLSLLITTTVAPGRSALISIQNFRFRVMIPVSDDITEPEGHSHYGVPRQLTTERNKEYEAGYADTRGL